MIGIMFKSYLDSLRVYALDKATEVGKIIVDDMKQKKNDKHHIEAAALRDDMAGIDKIIKELIEMSTKELVIEKRKLKPDAMRILAMETIAKDAYLLERTTQCASGHFRNILNEINE